MASTASNYPLFRECFSSAFLQRVSNHSQNPKASHSKERRRRGSKLVARKELTTTDAHGGDAANDPEELADFIEVSDDIT
jgi:hypothetical protein